MNKFINGVVMDKFAFIGDRGKRWVKWWENILEKGLKIQHHYYPFEIKATFAKYTGRTTFERPLTSGVAYAVRVLHSEKGTL
ncbi:hypothetical protein Scep_004912 [Stephania cephalantha]|uniref:Uncharacterized protein n=1 Tax=Stephania cephalantha TaxID=152367 RepID=A0AAP0KTB7_9MAGN